MTSRSPSWTCSTGISSSLFPSLVTLAIIGWRSISFLTALDAFSFVLVSRSLPTKINVIMIAAVSKYTDSNGKYPGAIVTAAL
jgi:hypothetical protein